MKARMVALGSWLFISVLCGCGDDGSPSREKDAGTGLAESQQDRAGKGGDGNVDSGSVPDKRAVGGEVSGLNGAGLKLELNDDDELDVDESGPFSFDAKLAEGSDYRVTVRAQPNHPAQTCEVTNGSGKVAALDIDSVRITCSDVKRTIVGSVTGLGGGEIKLRDYSGKEHIVSADGHFTFTTTFASGANDDVTIAATPIGRTCSLTRNHRGGDVIEVEIACYAGLTLRARALVNGAELTWDDNGATSYTVYRSTDKNCNFDAADGCEGSGKSENVSSPYTWIEGLDNGKVYYFHVRGNHPGNFTTASDQPAPGARPNVAEFDKQVRAISIGDNNTVYLGGDFSAVGPYTGPVAPIDKTTGHTSRMPNFPIIPGLSNAVRAVAADGSGGYFVGGVFTLLTEGGTRRNLVHVRADGTLDASWNPDPNGHVHDLSRVGDRLYVAGDFWRVGGIDRGGLAVVSTTGTGALDTQWDPNPEPRQFVLKIVASAAGVYIAGPITTVDGQSRTFLAKLNANNGDPEDFPQPDGTVTALALSDDALYVAGDFTNIGGVARHHLAAISVSDGQVQANPQFGYSEEPPPIAMVVSGDLLYLGGHFTTITIGSTSEPRSRLAAIDRVTGALADWRPEADAAVRALAASGDSIYVAGDFTHIGMTQHKYLAEIATNGSLRTAWAPQPGAAISGIALDNDSVFAFGSEVRSFGGQIREHLAAFQNGALTAWAPAVSGGNVHVLAAAGATIFVGGDFDRVGDNARVGVAAISDASTVRDWNAQLARNSGDKPIVRAIDLGSHSVYLGGNFAQGTGDDTRTNVVSLAFDNAKVSETWTLSGADGDVNAIAVDGTDNVFIGGAFNVVGPTALRARLAKLSADTGTLDGEWSPSANDAVHAMMVVGDYVFVGGAFTEITGVARERLAAIGKTGTGGVDSWTPVLNGTVYGMASEGRVLYAVGEFTNYGQGFAAIDTGRSDFPRAMGVLDVAAYGPVLAVAANGDRVYIGGDSRTVAAAVGGTSRCWFYCEQRMPALPP